MTSVLSHSIRDAFLTKEVGVSCIKSFSKGLILASEYGHFSYWKKYDSGADEEPSSINKKLYLHSTWDAPTTGPKVVSLDISAKESSLLVGFRNNHIATCNLNMICSGEAVV